MRREVDEQTMDDRPDDHTLREALALAVRAPSIHNTQPWRFRICRGTVQLYLDSARAVVASDPDGRDLLVSCGAALHHLRIALAARGWSAVVRRLPDPAVPQLLATIEPVRHRPTMTEISLNHAIPRRQSDRRRFSARAIPPGYLGLVSERAATRGGVLRRATDSSRDCLIEVFRASARAHSGDSSYQLELAEWSGRHATADGVPARNTPLAHEENGLAARPFATPELVESSEGPDYAELLVLGTARDDRSARLCAGEALSAVLLTATNVGLATCPLTEPLAIAELRKQVRTGVLDNLAHPQAVIRIGWSVDGAGALPFVPRRAVEEVLEPLDPVAPAC